MQRRIPRSALVAACVTALAAGAAGSAQAAVTATTTSATAVTATTATFNGSVSTGGAVTAWEFAYGLANNMFGGSYTAGGTIPAGTTAATPVLDTATGLMPSTTYTFQLVATDVTNGTTYYLNTPEYGGSLTFTTKGPGSASLASTKLKVKKGHVLVPVKCSKTLACGGGALTITTGHKTCASDSNFSVGAGKEKTVGAKLTSKCKSLLAKAPNGKLKAKLTTTFTYQKGVSKGVTIIS